MRYQSISRINRCDFSRATIALMIELNVYCGHTFKAIAIRFGCSDKTVAMYVNKYYYGNMFGHKKMIISRQSSINDYEEKEEAA